VKKLFPPPKGEKDPMGEYFPEFFKALASTMKVYYYSLFMFIFFKKKIFNSSKKKKKKKDSY